MRDTARFGPRFFGVPAVANVVAILGIAALAALVGACGGGATTSGSGGSGGGMASTGSGGAGVGSGGSASGGSGTGAGSGGSAVGSGGQVITGTGGATGGTISGSGGSSGSASGGKTGSGGTGGGGASAGAGGGATGSGGTMASGSGGGGGAGAAGGSSGGKPANPSPGCSNASPPKAGKVMIDVSGTAREFIVTIPDGYDSKHPYRLVLAFHGRMYNAQSVADGGPPGSGPYYGIQALSGGSTIFVAPQALDTSWTNQDGRDLAYVEAIVTRVGTDYCIDQNRVFATGFSMGAIMTINLGCSKSALFRAIGPMSGELPTEVNAGTCNDTRPIAYWGSHGTNDTTISPTKGKAAVDKFAMRNHCTTDTKPGTPAGCVDYQGCDATAPTTWCTFDGVHEPPPFAGQALWAFFSQF